MEVEKRVHASFGKLRDRARNRIHVGAREDAGFRLDRRVDDAEADDVQTVVGKCSGSSCPEARGRGLVWGLLVDHVQSVKDHDLTVAVREPPL